MYWCEVTGFLHGRSGWCFGRVVAKVLGSCCTGSMLADTSEVAHVESLKQEA
jgi:hypothetical protein